MQFIVDSQVEYGIKPDGICTVQYYRIGLAAFVGIYIPTQNCTRSNAIYYNLISNINRIFMNQYAGMNYVTELVGNFNNYYAWVNNVMPPYVKYMGVLRKEPYVLYTYPVLDIVQILTIDNKYVCLNLTVAADLFALDLKKIYDPTHYIPQEYIRRRIDATPKPVPVADQAASQTDQAASQTDQAASQADQAASQTDQAASQAEAPIRRRNPRRLNARRYVGYRRSRSF